MQKCVRLNSGYRSIAACLTLPSALYIQNTLTAVKYDSISAPNKRDLRRMVCLILGEKVAKEQRM